MSDAPPAPQPLSVDVVDAHCHLDIMGGSVTEHLAAAQAVGVRQVVTIGIDITSSRWCAETAAEHADVHAAVAIHPNEAHAAVDAALDEIEVLANSEHVVAVGETGLDYYRDTATREQQHTSFVRHIDIAKRHDKALVVHDRDAHNEVLRVLEHEGAPPRVVLHCFSGDASFARACAERGYFMSFAGNVTFKSAQPLRDAAAVVPIELLLVETDAPFLAPMPHRGRPNAPYLVPLTVRALAALRGEPEPDLAGAVRANAARAFGI